MTSQIELGNSSVCLVPFAAHITSLHLIATPGVNLETGDALVLQCQAGVDSILTTVTHFDVVWSINGTNSSNYPGTTASFSNGKHYLHVDPIFSNHSGTYSCELHDNREVKESLDITVNPGKYV